MKALNLYGKQDVRYEETEKPKAENRNDVIVEVKIAGICGSDISRYGKIGSYNPGLIWGHEFSGVVYEIGSDVRNFKIGDRVTACPCFPCYECEFCKKSEYSKCLNLKVLGGHVKGAFAEYIKMPSEHLIKIPENMSFETASLIEPSCVVVHGYNKAGIRAGDKVAVVGCGTIGLLSIQWAKVFGAGEVYAFDIDNKKLEKAQETGADYIFNTNNSDFTEKFLELTQDMGVQIVMESSGNEKGISNSLALAMKGGTVILTGIPYGDVFIERNNFEKIIRNELKVLGTWNSISAPFPGSEWRTSLYFMEKGSINLEPLITHKIHMHEAVEMFDRLYKKEEDFIKVLIEVNN